MLSQNTQENHQKIIPLQSDSMPTATCEILLFQALEAAGYISTLKPTESRLLCDIERVGGAV